jgi:hypothetical protein
MTAKKLLKRVDRPTKKRRKEANDIVDEMERVGKIREMYTDFRNEINSARESKAKFRGRGVA